MSIFFLGAVRKFHKIDDLSLCSLCSLHNILYRIFPRFQAAFQAFSAPAHAFAPLCLSTGRFSRQWLGMTQSRGVLRRETTIYHTLPKELPLCPRKNLPEDSLLHCLGEILISLPVPSGWGAPHRCRRRCNPARTPGRCLRPFPLSAESRSGSPWQSLPVWSR
mgnify:CR=1 FL=1